MNIDHERNMSREAGLKQLLRQQVSAAGLPEPVEEYRGIARPGQAGGGGERGMRKTARARCIVCDASAEAFTDHWPSVCPKCGARNWELNPDADVTVTINWHELRILCMWADWWAQRFPQTPDGDGARRSLNAIIQRLEKAAPSEQAAPLTFGGEIRQLREMFGEDSVEVHHVPGSERPSPN